MDIIINGLIDELLSPDFLQSQEAASVLAMLFEMNTRILGGMEETGTINYDDYIPQKYMGIRLDEKDQEDIIDNLLPKVGLNSGLASSLLWIMGKASPKACLGKLLEIIRNEGDKLDDEAAYQALIALDNFIVSENIETVCLSEALKKYDTLSFIERMAQSPNSRLSESAERVRRCLDRLKGYMD